MNSIGALCSHPVFHRLGVALLEFVWQGAIVAALWAAARAPLSRARPSARYAAGCLALAVMLALPCWTFWRTSGRASADTAPGTAHGAMSAFFSQEAGSSATISDPVRHTTSVPQDLRALLRSMEPWTVAIWAAGVLLLCLRFLTGWAALTRLRRGATREAEAALRETLSRVARRMRVSRPVKLLESAAIRVPAALGVLRPAILLPLSGLSGLSPAQIEALLAHELAHVRRHDYLVNLLQTAVETLLFYHPAVWWISRNVRLERESCCDDLAIAATGDARGYARALLRLEQERSAPAQLAVAATGATLLPRIARLFPRHDDEPFPSARAGAFLALAALVTLGAAVRGPASADSFLSPLPTSPAAPISEALAVIPAPAEIASDPPPQQQPVRSARLSSPRPAQAATEASDPTPVKAGQSRNLTAEELQDFRIHGVTADFIREIEALGYTHASTGALVSLRVHGVSPDFLRRINEVFGERISLDTAVELRIHGVGPDFVREMSGMLGKLSPDAARSLRIHGVSPEYLARFREQGYAALSAEEAIRMRNHGVDPSAAAEFVKMGFSKPSLDELLVARNHGVSIEYVREMRDAGLAIPDLTVLVALRNHGVTPEFVKAMRELGFPRLSADEATVLRNHGVTPEFVKDLRGLGYTNLSVDEAVALRNHGVTADFARKAKASAGKRLSVDELIDARIWKRREP